MKEPDASDRRRTSELSSPETPASPGRRRLLGWLTGGLAGLAALLASVPPIGVLLSPVLRRDPKAWRSVGRVEEFAVGETTLVRYLDPDPLPWAGFAGRSAAWLRREAPDSFSAFSVYCTHTGCPVTWTAGAELFMCPCHGGVFRRDGSVAAGPPPRPLDRLPVRVRGGRVEVLAHGAPVPD